MSVDLPPALGATPPIQLFRLVLTVSNHLRSRMDARLAPLGLTTQQAAVLTVIDRADPPPSLRAVAAAMSTSHQNARQIVSVLERKGLVEVRVDPDDRRALRIEATSKVAEVFSPRDLDDHEEVAAWFAVLSDEEQATVVSLLARVVRHLADDAPRDSR